MKKIILAFFEIISAVGSGITLFAHFALKEVPKAPKNNNWLYTSFVFLVIFLVLVFFNSKTKKNKTTF